jgi:hypothetical protein
MGNASLIRFIWTITTAFTSRKPRTACRSHRDLHKVIQSPVQTVGINQIKNVYEPIWTDGDQAQIWNGFKDMLFGEQWR